MKFQKKIFIAWSMKFYLFVVEDLEDLCRRVLGVKLLSVKTYLGLLSVSWSQWFNEIL